jgi:hypothetical protein
MVVSFSFLLHLVSKYLLGMNTGTDLFHVHDVSSDPELSSGARPLKRRVRNVENCNFPLPCELASKVLEKASSLGLSNLVLDLNYDSEHQSCDASSL